jgi:GDP-L-fucose synthase
MSISKLSKIFIAGHNGMVGSSILRLFKKKGYKNLITINKNQLNLMNEEKTNNFFLRKRPDFVIIAAAKVGGVLSNNTFRAEYIYQNLKIQNNLIHNSYLAGVKKLIFLGSSCIYPKLSKQPISENQLLSGKLEETNEPYAIAKIAGLKMCEAYNQQYKTNFICLMPTNLYGPSDNYDLKNSHFFPALIKKIVNAKKLGKKTITIWGDGTPKRELMYVDDLALACEHFLKKKTKHYLINVGSGYEKTILDYCKILMKKINYNLIVKFDKTKPNGTPRKIIDCTLAKRYGWKPRTSFDKGVEMTINDFLKNND